MRIKRFCMKMNLNSLGQALVEMALVLFLLLLLVFGIFEFGRAMYIKNTLTHAARAGARAAVVMPGIIDVSNANCSTSDANQKVYQTVCSSIYQGINPGDITIDVTRTDLNNSGTLDPGDMVTVKVILNSYHSKYRKIPFMPVKNTLTGETAMRYE